MKENERIQEILENIEVDVKDLIDYIKKYTEKEIIEKLINDYLIPELKELSKLYSF